MKSNNVNHLLLILGLALTTMMGRALATENSQLTFTVKVNQIAEDWDDDNTILVYVGGLVEVTPKWSLFTRM
jgi:hypothetical protein